MSVTSVHLNVTNKCNQKCSYCYFFEDDINISQQEPTLEQLKNYIDQAEDIGAKLLIISGGEALLRKDIFTILSHGNIPKMLLTNALLIDEEIINELNNIKTLKDVKISFDGFKGHDLNRGEGTSEIVEQKLYLIDKLGSFPYTINTVITQYNYRELLDIYDLISGTKCYRWEIDFPLLRGRTKSIDSYNIDEEVLYNDYIVPLIKNYLKDGCLFKMNIVGTFRWELLHYLKLCDNNFQLYTINDHPCQYAIDSFTVQTSGAVSFCPSLPIVFGNLNNSTLKDILKSEQYLKFKALTVNMIDKCNQCRYLQLCGGGCRADALALNKNINSLDPLSCRHMIVFEKYILNVLPDDIQTKIKSLINEDGYNPLSRGDK